MTKFKVGDVVITKAHERYSLLSPDGNDYFLIIEVDYNRGYYYYSYYDEHEFETHESTFLLIEQFLELYTDSMRED